MLKVKFLKSVAKTETCWTWTGAVRNSKLPRGGYGCFMIGRKLWISSRASYMLFNGDIPEGELVRHKCDNRLCVRPDHLELGTHQDNMNDMKQRKRCAVQHGEHHNNHKLFNDDIYEMRILHGFGFTNLELASMFKISDGMVSMILSKKRWSHI